jgi:hypothetical protein
LIRWSVWLSTLLLATYIALATFDCICKLLYWLSNNSRWVGVL